LFKNFQEEIKKIDWQDERLWLSEKNHKSWIGSKKLKAVKMGMVAIDIREEIHRLFLRSDKHGGFQF
jgi:hypothetical protein